MKRAAIYTRVSTGRQEEEQTIDAQRTEVEARIKADENLFLPDCYYEDDGWTGTLLARPALDKLRLDAQSNKFDILYFYDRGRLARKFVYQEVVLDELKSYDIECISLHDINGSSPEEQLMGNVMGIFHEYERIKIAERFRRGKLYKVREKKKLLGYNAPYGYNYHHRIKGGFEERDGYFSINEKEAEVVRQVFTWVSEGMSLREVIRKLHELGVPPKKQKRTTWTKGPISRLLTNSTYTGRHYYNKTEAVIAKNPKDPNKKYRRVKNDSRIARPRDEWLPIEVPRIISDELFSKVQKELERNKKFSRRNNSKNNYLLTGIIQCECGKPRTGDPASNGHTYYRCTDRLSKFPLPRECHAGGVNAPVLDALTWKKLEALLASPTLLKKQAQRWLSNSNKTPLNNKLDETKKRIGELDAEEKRYVKAYGSGILSERLYKEQMQELLVQRTNLNTILAQTEAELSKQPKLSLEELVAGSLKMLENLDFTDKKAIIRKLVTKIKASQKEVVIWGNIPILESSEVGFEPIDWHCRSAECRQEHPL